MTAHQIVTYGLLGAGAVLAALETIVRASTRYQWAADLAYRLRLIPEDDRTVEL